MIFGKINPTAKAAVSDSPFNHTTIDCPYMTAIARPYRLGSESVDFEVLYGTGTSVTVDGVLTLQNFIPYTRSMVNIGSDGLSNWGTDDSTILYNIAQALGTSITDIYIGDYN